jgi:hypothetical protein
MGEYRLNEEGDQRGLGRDPVCLLRTMLGSEPVAARVGLEVIRDGET